ncbi:MAG TPA: NADPH-dependent F420 reductase [Terriglobales bacterium]|nr:NADPH-dependent F420 reductase [Terriglobales bacterium]
MTHRIAVLGGTGPAGKGLSWRWAKAGEEVIIGSRDAARARNTAAEIAARVGSSAKIEGMENAAACEACDLLVLTVPFEGHALLLKQLEKHFRPGSVLIDATVALATAVGGRPTRTLGVWQGSCAEQAAELVPDGVTVAAAFHNISADSSNGDAPIESDVIVCSDDKRARQLASELAEKIPGVRAVDGGRLENSRVLEQITALLIGINIRYKGHAAGIRITGLPGKNQ